MKKLLAIITLLLTSNLLIAETTSGADHLLPCESVFDGTFRMVKYYETFKKFIPDLTESGIPWSVRIIHLDGRPPDMFPFVITLFQSNDEWNFSYVAIPCDSSGNPVNKPSVSVSKKLDKALANQVFELWTEVIRDTKYCEKEMSGICYGNGTFYSTFTPGNHYCGEAPAFIPSEGVMTSLYLAAFELEYYGRDKVSTTERLEMALRNLEKALRTSREKEKRHRKEK